MLFDTQFDWQNVGMAVALSLLVAYALAELAARLARLALMTLLGEGDPVTFRSPIVRGPIRLVRATVFLLALLAVAPPALKLAGAQITHGLEVQTLSDWLFRSGLRIALIAVVTYVITRFITTTVKRFEYTISQGTRLDVLERAKRARTLGGLIQNGLVVLVVAIAGLMVLQELNVNIMPVLTGAGIAGLAIGFGAQTLVKDVISGFFLILENQVRVGDVAVINGTGGLVEAISLRTIVLRDLEGVVHVFPNGSVTTLANRTLDFSYCVLDVGVAYKEDTDRVSDVLREIGESLMSDPQLRPSLLEPLEILGVDAFQDSQVVIKIRIKTVPIKQWEVGRELRRRIKKAFDQRGIEIPFPHRSIYFGEASKPWLIRQAAEN